MHKIVISGTDNRVSSDIKVETKQGTNGKTFKVVQFQVACGNGSYKDTKGNWQQRKADFVTVKTGNPYLVEKIIKTGEKGKCVNLVGTFNVWSIKTDNGTYNNGSCIVLEQGDSVDIFDVVATKKQASQSHPVQNDLDDIPEEVIDFENNSFMFGN